MYISSVSLSDSLSHNAVGVFNIKFTKIPSCELAKRLGGAEMTCSCQSVL